MDTLGESAQDVCARANIQVSRDILKVSTCKSLPFLPQP